MHRFRHTIEEERFCCLSVLVPEWRSNKFFSFWNSERGKNLGEYPFQRATEPNVEKI